MQPLSKIETLRGFNRREERARNYVYELYHDALLIATRKITRDSPDAEDLVNDAFEVLYGNEIHFKDIGDLRGFLFQTGRNISVNYLKRKELIQRKYAELQERLPYTDEDFDADICYSETRALIFKSIESLPDKLKTVFRLRYFDELSNDDVALQLNIAVKTAHNRFYDARRQLKWELEQVKRFSLYLLNLFL